MAEDEHGGGREGDELIEVRLTNHCHGQQDNLIIVDNNINTMARPENKA